MLKKLLTTKAHLYSCNVDLSCAKRLYELPKRETAINHVEVETMVKRKPEAFIMEDQMKVIQAKEWLTLKEAALLLNVSPLTLRRWALAGKVQSEKERRKHLFKKADLHKISRKHLCVNNMQLLY